MAITQHNFDWAVTERDLVIFVPNFGRKRYLAATLEWFETAVPEDRWITIVVNDGLHEDLSDLAARFNLAWFTFERNPVVERNGAMIRNYFIKRCRSRLLCTRDPEILIEGERFVEHVLGLPSGVVYRTGGMGLTETAEGLALQRPDSSCELLVGAEPVQEIPAVPFDGRAARLLPEGERVSKVAVLAAAGTTDVHVVSVLAEIDHPRSAVVGHAAPSVRRCSRCSRSSLILSR